MELIFKDSKLSDIILRDTSIITVLDRFGIALGVGDSTIEAVCAERDIDVDFFTAILNTFTRADYFPQEALTSFHVGQLVDYLRKTNNYYMQSILPNIERHFAFLIKTSSSNNNIVLMRQFFEEVKVEMTQRINDDSERWFPDLLGKADVVDLSSIKFPAAEQVATTNSIEDKIDDLLNMLVVHLRGDYDHNLCYAVIVAVQALKKDIMQNNRIRNRILNPLSVALGISC